MLWEENVGKNYRNWSELNKFFLLLKYRKIPKISPGAYIFQRPLLRGLFLEGLIFGGAYLRREICVSKSIGLACSGKEIYHFWFVLLCILEQIPCTSPQGAYIRRDNLTEGFLRCDFEGLIFFCISWAPSAVEVKQEGSPTKDTNKYIHHKIATTRLQAFACFFVSCYQK